ncbi:MAG: transcription termination/antitermination protein NusG [Candidatus Borkfalkiaceae bacterium]|nr:transcription termination/antitermination protein NusG [Christensenellaceae bacterium]
MEEARWYVIHTYSGYEAMVKDSLEKLIENNNLQDKICEIKIPTEETLEEKANGKKKVVERKKFPCYVFLKMIYSNDIWYLVTNTRGVTGFVGPQGRPLPLTEEEVARMGLEEVALEKPAEPGDEVQIVSGPLESFSGKVIAVNEVAQKIKVNVEMFGRNTDVEVDFVQVKKINIEKKEEI